MRRKIIFRTEASTRQGMGHLMRCISLAKMLCSDFDISFILSNLEAEIGEIIKKNGFECLFLSADSQDRKPADEVHLFSSADIVVLDGYNFTADYQRSIKNSGKFLVYIDDLCSWHMFADLVINVSDSVADGDYTGEEYTKYLLGSNFALLREPFLISAHLPPRTIEAVNSVFISMGGADINNYTLKMLEALKVVDRISEVHVLIGPVNPHAEVIVRYVAVHLHEKKVVIHRNIKADELNAILFNCQLAICPASGICMEAASVGIGMISGYTAENQVSILNGLDKNECIFNAGNFDVLSVEEISRLVTYFIADAGKVNRMIKNQKKLIDGNSPERYRDAFRKLCK